MNKIEFEIVTLEWKRIQDLNELPDEPGLYQIYGTSPLYGMDTLLYIGQGISLKNRVSTHFENKQAMLGRQPNKTCRYAELDKELLNAVEETLIAMHKPSFNSARLINVSRTTKQRPLYIQNHGDRGMLNIENTNYYFLEAMQPNHNPLYENLPSDISHL